MIGRKKKMNDLARIKAMFSKYPRFDKYNTYYKIVKIGKFTVIYLMTDDSYCSAELWFDKDGNFKYAKKYFHKANGIYGALYNFKCR